MAFRSGRSEPLPRLMLVDLSEYEMTRGTSKNGSLYASFRKEGKPTLTAFGETASTLVGMAMAGERSQLVLETGRMKAQRIVSVRCPVTGLPIEEGGRVAPTPQSEIRTLPALPEPEPSGFWAKTRDAVRGWLGIQDEAPAPVVVEEPVRSGYPVVDALIAKIEKALEDRPDLVDDKGQRFDDLADRRLFQMAESHARAVAGADAPDIREADAMFSEYLRIAEKSLDASLLRERETESRRNLDEMSTHLGYMRYRHGSLDAEAAGAPALVAIVEERRPAALLQDRSGETSGVPVPRSMAKGPVPAAMGDAALHMLHVGSGRGR